MSACLRYQLIKSSVWNGSTLHFELLVRESVKKHRVWPCSQAVARLSACLLLTPEPTCVELLLWRSLARPPPDRLELYWRSAPSWWWFVWISVQVSVRLRSCAASSGSCVSRAAFKYHPHVFLSVVRFWASQLVRGTFWPHIAVTHLCKIYLRSFVHKQTLFTTRQQRLRASAWKELIIHTTWSCGLRPLLLSESNHLSRLSSLFIPHCFTVIRLQVENTCWQVRLLSCSGNRLYKTDGRSVVTCWLVKSVLWSLKLDTEGYCMLIGEWLSITSC